MKPLGFHPLHRDLSAFVDGELDVATTHQLLRRVVADPSALEALHCLQQLTFTSRRAVRVRTPRPSKSLQEMLRRLTEMNTPGQKSVSRPLRSRMTRAMRSMMPYAVAATVLVAVGAWVGHYSARSGGPLPPRFRDTTGAEVLPAVAIARAEEVHGFCSRLAEGLHSAGYPAELAPLAASVQHDLRSEHPYPNLTAIGYRYRGAGPCGVQLGDTIHLLYRSLTPGSVKAISVFVQPWREQFSLVEGQLYTVSVATSGFPMLAWRTDRVVYFLLADDTTTVQKAASLIRGAPSSAATRVDSPQ